MSLCPQLFANPTSQYRGAPFWAWNCKLEAEELVRQIDIFKEMGLGGFFMHSRSGLATEYMGEDFLNMVEICNQKAIDTGMICYLYDEDRWPSGAAGGLVTKEHKYRQQMLVICPAEDDFGGGGAHTLLARYKIELLDGNLVGYERVGNDIATVDFSSSDGGGEIRLYEAYLAIAGNDPWYNNQAYVNTLDEASVARFIELTHEKYKERLGEYLGKSVPAIFTDEPQFCFKQNLARGTDKQAVTLPFTADFEETCVREYGAGVLDFLPELLWEWQDGRYSEARYRYHDHVCERFTRAFADQVGAWCDTNNIALTGHMMEEHSLTAQTRAIGDCMRAYRAFALPGIDMLADRREYATAKQAQSAAHQYGRAGVLSELYGATNWDFDFRGHKLQGDWQAALGVTLRVHHLSWVSMAGEAKRDYPASISYQSPWYKEYSLVENHFARVNTALTRGKPIIRIGVIHPVESLWVLFGPDDKTAAKRAELERQFENLTEWLLFAQLDFDFVSESLLADLYEETTDGKFRVGKMSYDTVIVPGLLRMRDTTRSALEKFANGVGTVIVMGELPPIAAAKNIPYTQTALLGALEPFREIDIIRNDGIRASRWIYQLRQDDEERWLFICNGTKPENQDIPQAEDVEISIKGIFTAELYDTIIGEISPLPVKYSQGKTVIARSLHMHDSLLIKLAAGRMQTDTTAPDEKLKDNLQAAYEVGRADASEGSDLPCPYAFTLSEPNVFLLDRASYAFDDGEWQAVERGEDILRIDNKFREKLGYPFRRNDKAQPWTTPPQGEPEHLLSLRFTIRSDIALETVHLALENAENTHIIWRGKDISFTPDGYYTDRSIQTVPLPGLGLGVNTLTLLIPFDQLTDVENCFLLGNFGVNVQGRDTVITPLPTALPFGDITRMGFPFYGGNLTYHCRVQGSGRARLTATHFTNPLLSVKMNGARAGVIAYAPYEVELGELGEGWNDISITAYGNRVNTFGTLHNAKKSHIWFGPDAWRTTGTHWANEYLVKPTGILVSPRIVVN